MKNNYYSIYIEYFYILILFVLCFVFLFMINQLLFGFIVYCDDPSNNATNIIESFERDE